MTLIKAAIAGMLVIAAGGTAIATKNLWSSDSKGEKSGSRAEDTEEEPTGTLYDSGGRQDSESVNGVKEK